MYEVMIYAAIATVVVVMLYSILGKQVGNGETLDPSSLMAKDKPAAPTDRPLSEEEDRLGLSAITAFDRDFSISQFMDGATAAYSMILEAYAGGDKDLLADLLTPEVYATYADAIDARETAGHTQVTDLGRLRKAAIKQAAVDGNLARIHVQYDAELTSALLDADGQVVLGDPDVLSSVSEVWEYERDMKSSDPNWRLADVAPSEGDELEADPTPDTKPA